jgi:hypothetical protein
MDAPTVSEGMRIQALPNSSRPLVDRHYIATTPDSGSEACADSRLKVDQCST